MDAQGGHVPVVSEERHGGQWGRCGPGRGGRQGRPGDKVIQVPGTRFLGAGYLARVRTWASMLGTGAEQRLAPLRTLCGGLC